MALRQLKQAVDSFLTVCKMQPKNADARAKYDLTKKEHRLMLLAAAVVNDERRATLDEKSITVESNYSGPKLDSVDDITPKWVETLMDW